MFRKLPTNEGEKMNMTDPDVEGYNTQIAESLRKKIGQLIGENARLKAAVIAFADHFGPIEDNIMLNDECRQCFRLARRALSTAQTETKEG